MKYVCDACGWTYDETLGDESLNIAPGTKFEDLPEDFEEEEIDLSKIREEYVPAEVTDEREELAKAVGEIFSAMAEINEVSAEEAEETQSVTEEVSETVEEIVEEPAEIEESVEEITEEISSVTE